MADGQVFKGTSTGALKGAALGAKLGTVVPGIGNVVGAGIGAVAGGISGGISANRNEKKREDALGNMPEGQDPTQISRMLEVDRIAKNIQAGTDSATQAAVDQGAQTTAATQNRLVRNTGGNVGATMDALLKSQSAGQAASNQAVAQGQSRLPFFMNLGQQIANRQSQRALELDLLKRAQTSAETAQEQKEGNVNFNSSLVSGVLGSDLGKASDRVGSLIGQAVGKIRGDMDVNPTPMAVIPTAQTSAPAINMSAIPGGGQGAGSNMNIGAMPLSGLTGIIGG